MRAADRALGLATIGLAAAIALVARTYTVGFVTDPLGPRALPYLVAGLLACGGAALVASPRLALPPLTGPVVFRQVAVLAVLFGYAAALDWIGFVPATALGGAALARAFDGPWVRGLAAAVAFAGILYAVFAVGFGLALPVGRLFGGG